MFELKVMEPGAFQFDYIAAQAGQSSAGMPENVWWTRREEAESFSMKLMKVTSVAWQPHATLNATLHATLPNCWQGQHFGALMLLRNDMKIQDNFSVLSVLTVCSVACGGCHVAYCASCSAVCR